MIARLAPKEPEGKLVRRAAVAHLDLALILPGIGKIDEACDAARRAISSRRVVPSGHWRVLEVVKVVEGRRMPEAADLRAAYDGLKQSGTAST
ncbi:hypothetical protein [Embleya sp. NPDC020886]|uniref:hypothetical protein n=1 Tax=Embleya sp. NPDC020886 TaxID=3363980 RepID=UPI0037B82AA6